MPISVPIKLIDPSPAGPQQPRRGRPSDSEAQVSASFSRTFCWLLRPPPSAPSRPVARSAALRTGPIPGEGDLIYIERVVFVPPGFLIRGAQNLEILFCARFGAVRGDLCTSPPAGAVDLVVFHGWFPDGDSAGAARRGAHPHPPPLFYRPRGWVRL